ncbi:hypothetical protein, partial [Aporhodopirellula aestuarii]
LVNGYVSVGGGAGMISRSPFVTSDAPQWFIKVPFAVMATPLSLKPVEMERTNGERSAKHLEAPENRARIRPAAIELT